jgi:hypothetical protein
MRLDPAGKNSQKGVWDQLGELSDLQEQAAEQVTQAWESSGSPSEVEFGMATDDHEAQTLGWPCVGAHRAVAARVWELTGAMIKLVPRGSTLVTAAAADVHNI